MVLVWCCLDYCDSSHIPGIYFCVLLVHCLFDRLELINFNAHINVILWRFLGSNEKKKTINGWRLFKFDDLICSSRFLFLVFFLLILILNVVFSDCLFASYGFSLCPLNILQERIFREFRDKFLDFESKQIDMHGCLEASHTWIYVHRLSQSNEHKRRWSFHIS